MRAKPEQIHKLSDLILSKLEQNKLLSHLKTRDVSLKVIEDVIYDDFAVEDEINTEAEAMLKQYAAKSGMALDREKLLSMIKKELYKKYKFVP